MNSPFVIEGGDKQKLAQLCKEERLYTPGAYLKHQYELMIDHKEACQHRRILVCHHGGETAGVILGVGKYIMVYVKPSKRRCGIGSQLIAAYARKYRIKRSNLEALTGSKGSGLLYFTNGVRRANSVMSFVEAFGYRVTIPLKRQYAKG